MIRAMKRAALALVLAACSSSSKDFPVLPEGSGPGGTSGTGTGPGGTVRDAGVDGVVSDAGVSITGRVCLIQDLRTPISKCATTGADKLTVALGTAHALDAGTTAVVGTATTAADGSFTMVAPLGPGLVWHVTGVALTTSVMDFGTENTIPAMLSELYGNLLKTNLGRLTLDDHGAVALRVVRGVAPVAGIAATVAPTADSDTFYDSANSATDWNQPPSLTQTGGMVWIPDAQLGPATITLTATGGTTHPVTTTVEDQAITFVTRTIP
jgi:hypothetical protein